MGKLAVNLDQIRKYSVPGPRYTSYPTAPHFSEKVQWAELAEHVNNNNAAPRELSLYFHLPFCQSLCWYCGCTTVITHDQGKSGIYLKYLKQEVEQMATRINPRRPVCQLHFGGGTPTFLLPDELRELGQLIRSHFRFADHYEAGVEIDPRGITPDHLQALRETGFNRVSLGVQDQNPDVQKAVHRIQPRELNQTVIEWIRAAGFESLNLDLIYGLPLQTVASFDRTLDEVLEFKPDRLAIFNFAYVPWLKHAQRALKIMPPEEKLAILKLTIEKLTSSGYVYIGMDHFAREDDELAVAQRNQTLQRNFQGYSTHGGADIYAFGMSSISQIDTAYWQNQKDLPRYYGALDQGLIPQAKGYILTADDRIRRETIMTLMCNLSLDYAVMSRRLGLDFSAYFAKELTSMDDMETDGLLGRTAAGLVVTDLGRLLIRNIAMRFDAYLAQGGADRFSKTL